MNKELKKKNWFALAKFYENLAHRYEDNHYYTHPIGISRKNKVLMMLNPQKNDMICDLGCGDGNLSKGIVKKVKEVYGVDISPTRVRRANKKGIKAICGDVCSIPFKSDCFEKVICSEVIEHIIEPRKLLREISRILRREGIAVLTVPANQKIEKTLLDIPIENLEQMEYDEIKKRHQIIDSHLYSFSEEHFIKLLKAEKFLIKYIDYTYNYEPKFKEKLLYVFLFLLNLRFIKKLNVGETVFNKIIFFFYKKKKNEKHHLIVQISKI